MANTLLNAALGYAQRFGWHVFPCEPRGKKPLTNHGFKDATTDPAIIAQWWERWPDANIGVACGPSKLVAIDADVKSGAPGLETWAALCAELQLDTTTPTALTPSDGQHVIYVTGDLDIGCSVGRLGSGLDVRARGGYIVAPPSIGSNGSAYRWAPGLSPNDVAPRPIAESLAERLATPKREAAPEPPEEPESDPPHPPDERERAYALAALADEKKLLISALPGERNVTLNKSAFSLGQLVSTGALSRDEVEIALYEACAGNALVADDGGRSVRATIESGLDAGMRKPRRIPRESDNEFLLHAGDHDEANARSVDRIYGRGFLHCPAYGWLHWTGTHWDRTHAEYHLDRAVVAILRRRRALAASVTGYKTTYRATRPSAANVRGCKSLLASLRMARVETFDRSPDELNVRNGVLNLRTGKLTPHAPSQRFTYCLPTEYDADADAHEWLDFLSAALGGSDEKAMRAYLQEALGYTLTGHTSEECLFYLYGPTRSGKGVFTETILALLGGKPLSTEVSFATFTSRRGGDTQNFDLAPLKPCRFVTAGEGGRNQKLNVALLKRMTGGNDIYCAFKYGTHFSYRPQFKVWLASNHPANADPDDDAAWYRVKTIHFPTSHAEREDKLLKARLHQPENLRGLLAWAVVGAQRWYRRGAGGLRPPSEVKRDTAEARYSLDYVQQWLDERVTRTGDDAFVENAYLYSNYQHWCEAVGYRPKGMRALTMALKQRGYQAGKLKWHDGKNRRGCVGIELAWGVASLSDRLLERAEH